jgi:hypothetical protein
MSRPKTDPPPRWPGRPRTEPGAHRRTVSQAEETDPPTTPRQDGDRARAIPANGVRSGNSPASNVTVPEPVPEGAAALGLASRRRSTAGLAASLS